MDTAQAVHPELPAGPRDATDIGPAWPGRRHGIRRLGEPNAVHAEFRSVNPAHEPNVVRENHASKPVRSGAIVHAHLDRAWTPAEKLITVLGQNPTVAVA